MDAWLLEALNLEIASTRLDDLMLLFSTAGLVMLPGIGAWMLFQRRYWRVALVLVGSLAATLALTLALQGLVLRPRPVDVRLIIATPAFWSFPSGHASLAFCAATLLALVYRRGWVLATGLLGALAVGLSRVYLGHHYPSDILGGALLGAGVAALFYGLWLGRGPRLRWGIWPQLSLVLIITQMAYLGLLPRGWSLGLPYADKALHFLLFGMLAFWLHLWLRGRRIPLRRWPRLSLAGAIVLTAAAFEELLQMLSPNRSADPLDLVCDLVGIVVFVRAAERLLRRKRPPPRETSIARRSTSVASASQSRNIRTSCDGSSSPAGRPALRPAPWPDGRGGRSV
jgi:membrane-associated phospholipid phosphatase